MKRFLLAFVAFFLSFSSFAQIEVNDGASDSWDKEMFSPASENPGFTSAYDIMVKESSIDVQVEGIYNITFTYDGVGSYALHMLGVELLDAEGNVISKDYHYGEAGGAPSYNVYTVNVVKDAKTIRYYAENYRPIDSEGTISFVLLNAEEWESKFWAPVRAEYVSDAIKNVHDDFTVIDNKFYVKKMDALLSLEKGMHTFDFNYLSGASSLRIGAVELFNLNGDLVDGDYHYGVAGTSTVTKDNQYSLNVPEEGIYRVRYYCSNKSAANNSTGNVIISSIPSVVLYNEVGAQINWAHITGFYSTSVAKDMSAPFHAMKSEDAPEGIRALSSVPEYNIKVSERIVTISESSCVEVEFVYSDGSMALNLAGVDFVDNEGNVVASHYKLYSEGSNKAVVSKYTLAPVTPGTYTMRCFVLLEGDRKIDSKGDINLTGIGLGDAIRASKNSVTPDTFTWEPSLFIATGMVPQQITDAGSTGVRVMRRLIEIEGEEDFALYVGFRYEKNSGPSALDVAGVDIVDMHGNVVAKEYAFSMHGYNEDAKKYKLKVSTPGKYMLRIFNGQEGKSAREVNSRGNVLLSLGKFEASTLDVSKYYYYIKGENGQYISAESGNATLVDAKVNASKFYFKENGAAYNLISFEAGLYMDLLSGSKLATAAVDSIPDLALGKGFGSGKSVLIKAGDNYLTNELGVTTDIDDNISWTLEEVDSLSFSISSARYSTLCVPVEVKIPEGVKAYTFGGLNVTDGVGVLNLKKVTTDYIPKEEAVLIFSVDPAGGDFKFALTGGNHGNIEGNDFLGTIVKRTFNLTDEQIFMYLTKVGDEVGFYKRKSKDFTFGANKAYFYLTPEQQAAVSRGMSMRLIDGTTGIEDVPVDAVVEDTIYDLQGRRLDDVTAPGIYIVNGKKMYIK